jgi:hypothetical protein
MPELVKVIKYSCFREGFHTLVLELGWFTAVLDERTQSM